MIKELPHSDHNHGHDDFFPEERDRWSIAGKLGVDYVFHAPETPHMDQSISILGPWEIIRPQNSNEC